MTDSTPMTIPECVVAWAARLGITVDPAKIPLSDANDANLATQIAKLTDLNTRISTAQALSSALHTSMDDLNATLATYNADLATIQAEIDDADPVTPEMYANRVTKRGQISASLTQLQAVTSSKATQDNIIVTLTSQVTTTQRAITKCEALQTLYSTATFTV